VCQLISTDLKGENYVAIVLDDSGSMDEAMSTRKGRIRRIDAAKNALRTVLNNLPEETKIGLLTLNRTGVDGTWLYSISSANRQAFLEVVNSIEANGATPLGQAMKIATDSLLASRREDPFGTFRLLVVTDGEATDAPLLESYLPDIISRGITVDVIGVDMERDHSLATQVHQYRRADDAEALNQAIAAVFAESGSSTDQSGETDFDLIASLPDEFAAEALAAVSTINNTPIGESDAWSETNNDPTSTSQGPNFTPASPSFSPENDTQTGTGTSCCFASFIVFITLVVVFGSSIKKRR
jgi:uncharacterized protein YegL